MFTCCEDLRIDPVPQHWPFFAHRWLAGRFDSSFLHRAADSFNPKHPVSACCPMDILRPVKWLCLSILTRSEREKCLLYIKKICHLRWLKVKNSCSRLFSAIVQASHCYNTTAIPDATTWAVSLGFSYEMSFACIFFLAWTTACTSCCFSCSSLLRIRFTRCLINHWNSSHMCLWLDVCVLQSSQSVAWVSYVVAFAAFGWQAQNEPTMNLPVKLVSQIILTLEEQTTQKMVSLQECLLSQACIHKWMHAALGHWNI